MIDNKINSGNINQLHQFAVKSRHQVKVFGDRAVTWNRCSREKQSYDWQQKVTSDFVRQNKWSLIKSFGAKESAKTNDGIEFKEMINYCLKENISHIVFFSYDSFSRPGDLTIIEELRSKGIKVHAATQAADDETPSGRMIQKLYLMFIENGQ